MSTLLLAVFSALACVGLLMLAASCAFGEGSSVTIKREAAGVKVEQAASAPEPQR